MPNDVRTPPAGPRVLLRAAVARADVDADDAARSILGEAFRTRDDDGLLAQFAASADAVRAALRLQRTLGSARVRVSLVRAPASGANGRAGTRRVDRLLALARPGQILMTRVDFDEARQVIDTHPVPATGDTEPLRLRWMAHGPYLVPDETEPLEVYEVGAEGLAPLLAPEGNPAAQRAVPPGADDVLGWRPGAGLDIPGRTEWRLERLLGEGGFGEVWLARHRSSRAERVFKFCFDAERLRSFQREIALFRLLREALGQRPDIAQLHDVHLDRPPYYLESAFTKAGSLVEWAASRGGIGTVPLEVRLDLVARIADAVDAAHSVGILHKDLKPSNVLIDEGADGTPRPRLADFGIGALADRNELRRHHIVIDGFTETLGAKTERSRTGTRLYAPPETLTGEAFTTRGDIYALGVMLYQLVRGDLTRPLGHGWERDVPDPLLRADIADCVAARPDDRLAGARDLAVRLRTLSERRAAVRRQATRRTLTAATVVLAVLAVVVTGLFLHERGLRREIAVERDRAERQARIAREVNTFLTDDLLAAANPENARGREITVREVLDLAAGRADGRFEDAPLVRASILDTLGTTYRALGHYDRAEPRLAQALRLHRAHLGDAAAETCASQHDLGQLYYDQSRYAEAEPLMVAALAGRTRAFGASDDRTLESQTNLAALRARMSEIDEAIALQRRALASTTTAHGADSPEAAGVMHNLAGFLKDAGAYEEAERLFARTLELRTRHLPADHPHTLATMNALGTLYYEVGRDEEAEALLVETLAARRRVLHDDHPDTLMTISTLGDVERRRGRPDRAEPLLAEALDKRRRLLGDDHEATLDSMNKLASLYVDTARLDEAEPLYRATLAGRRRVLPAGHGAILTSMSNLGRLLTMTGRHAAAEPLFAEAVGSARTTYPPGHWFTAIYLQRWGECLTGLVRYEEAEAALLEAHGVLVDKLGRDHDRTVGARRALAALYDAWDRPDDAAIWRADVPALDPATTGPSAPTRPRPVVELEIRGAEQTDVPTLDLGRVPTNGSAAGVVRLVNRTTADVTVADCRTSCACTTAECPRGASIAPDGRRDVPVRMRTDVSPGANVKTMTFILPGLGVARVLVRTEAYRLIDPTPAHIGPNLVPDGRVTLRANDDRAFRVTTIDPPIANVPTTAAALTQTITVDWQRWRTAGSPRAIIVHTDHPSCPGVQVTVATPVPE